MANKKLNAVAFVLNRIENLTEKAASGHLTVFNSKVKRGVDNNYLKVICQTQNVLLSI